jgi:hypothetical protein
MSRFPIITTVLAAMLALPAAAADTPGYFKVPGTDTSISLYGYVALDGTYDLLGTVPPQSAGISMYNTILDGPGTVPGAYPSQSYELSAQRSRFGFITTTPTDLGDLKVRIEGDFLGKSGGSGPSNRTDFRLRQAYGELGGFLVGQSDSLFVDPAAYPDIVDFDMAVGSWTTFTRWAQVRYTCHPSNNTVLAFSVEDPYTQRNSGATTTNKDYSEFPNNVVGAFDYKDTWGHIGLRLAYQRFGYFTGQTSTTPQVSFSDTSLSWVVSGNVKFGSDNLVYNVGRGSGNYGMLFGTLGSASSTGVIADGPQLNATSSGYTGIVSPYQGGAGYTHVWTPKLRSNLILGEVKWNEDDSLGVNGNKVRKIDAIYLNTFINPTKSTTVGIEYERIQTHTFDDNTITYADQSKHDGLTESRIEVACTYKFF